MLRFITGAHTTTAASNAAPTEGSPAVGSPPAGRRRSSTQGGLLRRLPEPLFLHVLKFLPLEDILKKVVLLDSHCSRLARSTDFWENQLTELYSLPDLMEPVINRPPLAERRSKGKVQVVRMKGTGKLFAMRTVSLETTNAGKDDGVPTSCLRELAVAGDLQHPNLLRCLGGWVDGPTLTLVSEYCGNSLFNRLSQGGLPSSLVKSFLRQILSAVAALHSRGIVHRNIKSDNIILCPNSATADGFPVVKLCDLSTSRVIDLPIGAYTPEDPKERDRSYREQRRLYNRSPELILRQTLYAGEVDVWAVGCLFAEMALGEPLFRCEAEIGLLLSALQICGTPPIALWDRLSSNAEIFLKLPRWDPIDMRAVALTLMTPEYRQLRSAAPPLQRYSSRTDVLEMLLNFGSKVGPGGLMLLERLLVVPSCFRVTADEALGFPYFMDETPAAAATIQQWYMTYHAPDNICEMPLEDRCMAHFQRFIEIEKARFTEAQRGAASPLDDEATFSAIKAMENRSFNVPDRFASVAAMPFDYRLELERLKSTAVDAANEGIAHGAAAVGSIQPDSGTAGSDSHDNGQGVMTPVPAARKEAHRFPPRCSGGSPPTVVSPSGGSLADIWASPVDGTCCAMWDQNWQQSLDFELDHECAPPLQGVRPAVLLSAVATTATTTAPSETMEDEPSTGGGEPSFPRCPRSPDVQLERLFCSEGARKLAALSQSPVHAAQRGGQADPTAVLRRRNRLMGLQSIFVAPPGQQWIARRTARMVAGREEVQMPLPWLQPRIGPRTRLEIVNFMMGIQPEFLLRSQTLHLGVSLFDRYACHLLGHPSRFTSSDFLTLALACLKIADLYNEVSKEYYKQDNVTEYADFAAAPGAHLDEMTDASGRPLRSVVVAPAELLAEEKKVLNLLSFRVLHPTTCWLMDAYLGVAKLLHLTHFVDYCHYLCDLGLYSHKLLAFRPALQAQCMLLVACCTLYRPRVQGLNGSRILRYQDPQYAPALGHYLRHFVWKRDTLCSANSVWEVLDCLAVLESLLTDGKRLFEAMALRSVEWLHAWVSRSVITVATQIPPKLARCILPSSQDDLLASLDQ